MQPGPRDYYSIDVARKSSWELEPPVGSTGSQIDFILSFIRAHGQSTIFLLLLGAVVGLLETGIDSGIGGFGKAIGIMLERTSSTGYGIQLLVFIAFVLSLTTAAAILTKFVDPKA